MFDLGFSEEFFWGEGYGPDGPYPEVSEEPESLFQALYSLSWEELQRLREVFNSDPYQTTDSFVLELMQRAREVNTCSHLTVPVEVWLDSQGHESIRVYS